jgi:hypothetical protein
MTAINKKHMATTQTSDAVLLFGPKFRRFGCDVAREYVRRNEDSATVHGLVTGPLSAYRMVSNLIPDLAGELWHLPELELQWLKTKPNRVRGLLRELEKELGTGVVGRLIVADRRLGKAYAFGGLSRPDRLARLCRGTNGDGAERYIAGLYAFLDAFLQRLSPRVVFAYAVAGAPALLLGELCNAREVPFAAQASARVEDRYVIDNDPKTLLKNVSERYQDAIRGKAEVTGEATVWAERYLRNFRQTPMQPAYARANKAKLRPKAMMRLLGNAIMATLAFSFPLLTKNRERDVDSLLRPWFAVYVLARQIWSVATVRTDELPSTAFVYFPLHIEPEASTSVRAPQHTNQLAVIEALSKSLPANMQLVVKDHAGMIGRRPKGYYRKIRGLPRVRLIRHSRSSFHLIRRSAVTAVITGTAAWEALLLGRRALVLGDSPFITIEEGLIHGPSLDKLSDALSLACEKKPASDRTLLTYLSVLFDQSFRMRPSLLWGVYESHSQVERQKAANHFVDGILERIGDATDAVRFTE